MCTSLWLFRFAHWYACLPVFKGLVISSGFAPWLLALNFVAAFEHVFRGCKSGRVVRGVWCRCTFYRNRVKGFCILDSRVYCILMQMSANHLCLDSSSEFRQHLYCC